MARDPWPPSQPFQTGARVQAGELFIDAYVPFPLAGDVDNHGLVQLSERSPRGIGTAAKFGAMSTKFEKLGGKAEDMSTSRESKPLR